MSQASPESQQQTRFARPPAEAASKNQQDHLLELKKNLSQGILTVLGALTRAASADERKKAYRQLARLVHPDKNPSFSTDEGLQISQRIMEEAETFKDEGASSSQVDATLRELRNLAAALQAGQAIESSQPKTRERKGLTVEEMYAGLAKDIERTRKDMAEVSADIQEEERALEDLAKTLHKAHKDIADSSLSSENATSLKAAAAKLEASLQSRRYGLQVMAERRTSLEAAYQPYAVYLEGKQRLAEGQQKITSIDTYLRESEPTLNALKAEMTALEKKGWESWTKVEALMKTAITDPTLLALTEKLKAMVHWRTITPAHIAAPHLALWNQDYLQKTAAHEKRRLELQKPIQDEEAVRGTIRAEFDAVRQKHGAVLGAMQQAFQDRKAAEGSSEHIKQWLAQHRTYLERIVNPPTSS